MLQPTDNGLTLIAVCFAAVAASHLPPAERRGHQGSTRRQSYRGLRRPVRRSANLRAKSRRCPLPFGSNFVEVEPGRFEVDGSVDATQLKVVSCEGGHSSLQCRQPGALSSRVRPSLRYWRFRPHPDGRRSQCWSSASWTILIWAEGLCFFLACARAPSAVATPRSEIDIATTSFHLLSDGLEGDTLDI